MQRIEELKKEIKELKERKNSSSEYLSRVIKSKEKMENTRKIVLITSIPIYIITNYLAFFVLSGVLLKNIPSLYFLISSIVFLQTNKRIYDIVEEYKEEKIEMDYHLEKTDILIEQSELELEYLLQLKEIENKETEEIMEENGIYTKEQVAIYKKYGNTIFPSFLTAGFFVDDIFEFISNCSEEECEIVGTMLQMKIIPLSFLYDNYTLYEEPVLLIQEEKPESLSKEEYLQYCQRQCELFVTEFNKRQNPKKLKK